MTIHSYIFKLATLPPEVAAHFELRHSIFVTEQGLFQDSDVDELDAISYPIIALKKLSPTPHELPNPNPEPWAIHRVVPTPNSELRTPNSPVLGIVRIYEPEPGLWYGGRLGVHPDYRRAGSIGKGLIYKAVTTANTWGCERFLATVQLPNVRFFQRLHWYSLQELTICDRPHHLMEADLNHYPPGTELRPISCTCEAQAC